MTFNAGYGRGRHGVSAPPACSVFVIKHRRGTLDVDMPAHRQGAMRKVRGNFVARLREVNGQDDHVHLPVHYLPKVLVSALMNILKGVPARRLRWQFTGGAPLSVIRHNIKQQRAPLHAISGLTPP